MTKVYRITPLEKKNVVITHDVFEEGPDLTLRGWQVEETYRWGIGFRDLGDSISEWEMGNNGIYCDLRAGYGTELDDLCACYFEYDKDFTDEEKQEIEKNWDEGGAGWLHDGAHNWQVERDELLILGPVKIDIVDDVTGEVFEENIKPVPSPQLNTSSTAWPFPTK
jgi:hypothetical protein